MQKIAVVLVTFNRLDKLMVALDCYEKQNVSFEKMIIVDNHSTDGTIEYLKKWETEKGNFLRKVIYLEENTGGAGGFGSGMEEALREIDNNDLDVDWVLVSDDDAFPEQDALKKLADFYEKLGSEQRKDIVSLSSAVINHGDIHEAHRSKIDKKAFRIRFVGVDKREYENPFFEIDLFSYVGTMIKVDALRKAGTTNKELFIYGDDNEHSLRLKNYGKLICVTGSRFIHDTPGVETRKIGWHNYYNRRNQLYILKKYFPKRYLYARLIKRYFLDVSMFSSHAKKEKELFRVAHNDALSGNLGKHPVYKPGFKFE